VKVKVLIGALVAGAALVPLAFASGQKQPATGAGCKPQVAVIIVGKAAADATATQVSLDVRSGNRFARPLFAKNTTTNVMVTTTATTKITTSGGTPVSLTAVDKGERVLAKYRVCKADLKGATASSLATLLTSLSPKKVVELG
jgi:hypothetical protein